MSATEKAVYAGQIAKDVTAYLERPWEGRELDVGGSLATAIEILAEAVEMLAQERAS